MAQKSIFELDLIKLAKWHRRCSLAVITMIVVWVAAIFLSVYNVNNPNISIALWVFYLFTMLGSAILVFPTHRSMGYGVFSGLIWAFFALLIPFLSLLSIASTGGLILRLAGAKTGTLGVSKAHIDRIRPNHCRQCGYSREGLALLQECPECQRVPQVI